MNSNVVIDLLFFPTPMGWDPNTAPHAFSNGRMQYSSLITSLFKAVQDVRTTFEKKLRIYPVIFLRDDIYELVQDSDKNKWGDSRVDLNWDTEKITRLIAFRISLGSSKTSCRQASRSWARFQRRSQLRAAHSSEDTLRSRAA
jgi:hypothetical protein